MENSHVSSTLWNKSSFNYSFIFNKTENTFNTEYSDAFSEVREVVAWILICLGFVLTLVVIFAVLSMAKKNHGAPVYVINLLISDLIQLGSRIPLMLPDPDYVSLFAFLLGFVASVGFMVCVSMERYLVIAKPLWYRFRRNIKTSVLVCVAVWILSFIILAFGYTVEDQVSEIIFGVFLLLPIPLFIFFLAGTIKALSEASCVPADEKRRIVSILAVVLFTYILLFLPIAMCCLFNGTENFIFLFVVFICAALSPLADSALYILLRKSAFDKLLASLCCCKMSNNQEISRTDNDNMSALCTTAV